MRALWQRYIRWWGLPYREWTRQRRTVFYISTVTIALIVTIVMNVVLLPAIDH